MDKLLKHKGIQRKKSVDCFIHMAGKWAYKYVYAENAFEFLKELLLLLMIMMIFVIQIIIIIIIIIKLILLDKIKDKYW